MALFAVPTGSSTESSITEYPVYSRLRKPVLGSRFPTSKVSHNTEDLKQPTHIPMNVNSVIEYKDAMKERYEDTQMRTVAAFDITREWECKDGYTSNCRQAEGAYDYFTQSYNIGHKPHCGDCATEVKLMWKNFESLYYYRDSENYLDLQRFKDTTYARARNLIRRAVHRRLVKLRRETPANEVPLKLHNLKIVLKTAMRRWKADTILFQNWIEDWVDHSRDSVALLSDEYEDRMYVASLLLRSQYKALDDVSDAESEVSFTYRRKKADFDYDDISGGECDKVKGM
ncbi:hypothetical protein K491DRAFT_747471 [Lophiostoma macrostomum CBS 122681]|uniref:Uncharacterized protein n=1 Tax=Lophiostoma macrostomum CBS 122681 TaxID=1314788 RepID=A0A6A6T5A5_9PLEO|nr:hypothetical protein K491DRAFT_747471 [Lophiostoma macrostomum CBS 122681]